MSFSQKTHAAAHRPHDGPSSDSDVDSFTEDLDSIGRFNIPKLSTYINTDNLPSLPNFASLGGFPNLPQFPNFGSLPSANLPTFDLAEVSKYVREYVNSATSGTDTWGSFESRANFINSVKTSLAMRMQMTTFLSDLKGGQSLQAAIGRLQPITELIHEAVTLPVDESDEENDEINEDLNETEPVGVGQIVNREQPFVNDLVVPDADTIAGVLHPTPTRRPRRKRFSALNARILSDDYGSNTDLDTVDELTREEAEVLTHLDSLDDFFKEDMLRRKIQKIQAHDSLSQHSKNKLVTKLMMGNYYKYINERIGREQRGGKEGTENMANDVEHVEKVSAGKEGNDDSNRACSGTHSKGSSTASTFSHALGNLATPASGSSAATRDGDEKAGYEDDIDPEGDNELDHDIGDDEVVLTELDTQPSYHNEPLAILGCTHYQRNCKLECPTCFRWFACRFCHDAQISDHKLSRADVRHILCMKCNTPQVPDTSYCVNCEEELANYFCLKCVLYDNDTQKDIYHCDKCGICRLGLGLAKDYFHCDTCNICLSIDLKEHHRCVSNTTHCNCPICSEYLFTSVSKVVFMKCGHSIHESCYDEMIKHSYKCPICKKTVVNTETQFRILDQEIRSSPLPAPYDKWRCIISCNDCKGKSSCAYHVMGLKCRYCASYNTNQLKLIKPEEAEEEAETDDDADEEDVARSTMMRLIKTNLGSNFLIDEQTTHSNEGARDDETGKYDSAYDGDYNDEEGEEDDMAAMVNMRRLTRAVLGERNVDRTSISAMFQNFINATIMDDAPAGKTEGESDESKV